MGKVPKPPRSWLGAGGMAIALLGVMRCPNLSRTPAAEHLSHFPISHPKLMLIMVLPFFQMLTPPIASVLSWIVLAILLGVFRARMFVEYWVCTMLLNAFVVHTVPGDGLRSWVEIPILEALAMSVGWAVLVDLWFGRLGIRNKTSAFAGAFRSQVARFRQPKCPGRMFSERWLGLGIWAAGLPILCAPHPTYATYQWLLLQLFLMVVVLLTVFSGQFRSPGQSLGWTVIFVSTMHIALLWWQGPGAQHSLWTGLPELMVLAAIVGLALTLRSQRELALLFKGIHPNFRLTAKHHEGQVIRTRTAANYRDSNRTIFAGYAPTTGPINGRDWTVGAVGLVAALVLFFVS